MLHLTFLFLGQLWQLFEVSQILEFLRYARKFIKGTMYKLNGNFFSDENYKATLRYCDTFMS